MARPRFRSWRKKAELDELPLPYRFDVKPFASIRLQALRDHIERVGIPLYPVASPT